MSPQPRQSRSCMYYSSNADCCHHVAWAVRRYFGLQTNWLYSAYLIITFPVYICFFLFIYLFWLYLLMFVRSTWGNVVSQVGKVNSATDLAMRNSTAGIATHHAGVSTTQRATPRMVCVLFSYHFLSALFRWWHFWAVCDISAPSFGVASAS